MADAKTVVACVFSSAISILLPKIHILRIKSLWPSRSIACVRNRRLLHALKQRFIRQVDQWPLLY